MLARASISHRSSRGAAILAAMLVTATVATLATGMLTQINGWFARSEASRNTAQAQSLANIAVRWASQYLAEESRLGPLDHLGELWASGLPPMPLEGGTLGGAIRDAQARFNLNNIVLQNGDLSEGDLRFAQALFEVAKVPTAQLGILVNQRRLRPLTELDIPAPLRPLASALPERTSLNVNTAAAPLLALLAPGANPETWVIRATKPFMSTHDFFQRAALEGGTPMPPLIELSVATRFFEVETQATFGNERAGSIALVNRQNGIIWQIAR